MNIHPILVHFPIGLLTIYALLELVRWRRWQSPALFAIRAFLVIVGFAAVCLTWLSGQLAERSSYRSSLAHPELIEIHSRLALLTVLVFAILAGAYVIRVLEIWDWPATRSLVRLFTGLAKIIIDSAIAPMLAIVGLVLLTLTGGLGGVIVYGQSLDPFTRLIYQLFKSLASTQ